MFQVNWGRVREAYPGDRKQAADEAIAALTLADPAQGATAVVQLLGHKGGLMVIAFRQSVDDLGRTQLARARSKLYPFLDPTYSYVAVVELGMYDMTAKIHRQLAEQGMTSEDEAYQRGFDEEMERQ